MQTNCILIASKFVSHSRYWLQIKILNSLLFYLFTFAINLWHRKFVTADITAVSVNNQHGMKQHGQDFDETFIWNEYEKRLAILNTKNIKICGWITQLVAIKMQFVCLSATSAECLQKIWIWISQGSVATCLRWGGYCCMVFVANFIRFPVVRKFWKSLKIWQSYREFKGGNFFEAQCSYIYIK